MKKNTRSMLTIMSVFVLVAVAIGYAMGYDISSLLFGGGGTLAMGVVVGETTTTQTMASDPNATEFIQPDVDADIADIAPYLAPLDTVMRRIGSEPCEAWEFKFYQADTLPVEDTAGATQDAASPNGIRGLLVSNPDMWRVNDTCVIRSIPSDLVPSQPVQCAVATIDRTTGKLGLYALNTTNNVCPVIAPSTVLYNYGPAFDEEANSGEPYGQIPEDASNYCQKFLIEVRQSNISKKVKKEVEWTLENVQQKALFDLRRKMEFTFLDGCKVFFQDPITKRTIYKTGGLLNFIDKIIDYHATDVFDDDLFNAWAEQIFTGNNGSENRYLFAGSDFMKKLGTVPTVSKQIDASKTTDVKLGITFNQITTVFGTLNIYHHQGMKEIGLSGDAIVVDLNNVKKRVLQPMGWESLPGVKSSGAGDVDARVLTEISGLSVKNKDTHARIRLVA